MLSPPSLSVGMEIKNRQIVDVCPNVSNIDFFIDFCLAFA